MGEADSLNMSRSPSAKKDRPDLAPLDALGRKIQRVLDDVKPHLSAAGEPPNPNSYDGYCGAASEAYLYLAGGRDSGLKVKRLGDGEFNHWWLEDESGRVIDLTLGPTDRRRLRKHPRKGHPYEQGNVTMFRRGYARPSRRAMAIIRLVRAQDEGG